MTDRAKGLTVVLAKDMRVDDLERIADAIRLIGGIVSVTPVLATSNDYLIEERVRADMRERLFRALDDPGVTGVTVTSG